MTTISERIKEGLRIRKMIQADLVAKTGIGKSSISTYISGEYEPKQKNIYKIAKALDVSEAWLMGFDVPMSQKEYGKYDDSIKNLPSNDKDDEIIKLFSKLPADKLPQAIDYLKYLVASADEDEQ